MQFLKTDAFVDRLQPIFYHLDLLNTHKTLEILKFPSALDLSYLPKQPLLQGPARIRHLQVSTRATPHILYNDLPIKYKIYCSKPEIKPFSPL